MRWGIHLLIGGLVVLVCGLLWFKVIRYRLPRPLPAGECTWYAAAQAKEAGWELDFAQQFGRDAWRWPELVRNSELVAEPLEGAIMVLGPWDGNPYGHVAYVEEVNGSRFAVTHANMKVGVKVFSRDGVPIRRVEVVIDGNRVQFEEGGKLDYPLIGFLEKVEK